MRTTSEAMCSSEPVEVTASARAPPSSLAEFGPFWAGKQGTGFAPPRFVYTEPADPQRPRVWVAGAGDELLGTCRLLDAKAALTWGGSVEEAPLRMHGAQADLLVVCSAPSRRVSSAAIL